MDNKRYLKEFEKHADYEIFITGTQANFPNVSICDDETSTVHYNQSAPVSE